MNIPPAALEWLLAAGTPAVRYNARLLAGMPPPDRAELLSDPFVQENLRSLRGWDGEVLERHNTPTLLMHRLALVADLGVRADDPGAADIVDAILARANADGIPEIVIRIPKAFGGSGEPERAWLICDYPLILYGLLAVGSAHPAVDRALAALETLADDNGYRCRGAFPGFRGPGRKTDFCPIACLYAARALSVRPETATSAAAGKAVAALLDHWENGQKEKHFLFGVGSDYRKLKYPLVWYNLLHVLDTVSRFPAFRADARVNQMAETLLAKADGQLRFKPESVYLAFKGQDFADKKNFSPGVTLAAWRILERLGRL